MSEPKFTRDLQGLVKWDVGTTTKRVANLGIPIHLKAIVRAAKANNRKFFIRLGKLLEEENKRLTQPATRGKIIFCTHS